MEIYKINGQPSVIEPMENQKFGEIYCNFEGKLTFQCFFCSTRMKEIAEFIVHYMIHFEEVFVLKTEDDVPSQLADINLEHFDKKTHETNAQDIISNSVSYTKTASDINEKCKNKDRRHESSKQFDIPQNCNLCGKDFLNKLAWERHNEYHAIGLLPDIYECDICGRKIKLKKDLLNHMRRTHSNERYPCTLCGKQFTRACYVSIHMKMHKEIRPFQCDVCGKTFVMSGALTSHKRFHDNTLTQCPCLVCGKVFNRPGTLADHIRIHNGDKPFKCECGAKFRTKRYLNEHKTRHLKVKNFSCDLCGMKFKQPAGVKSHKRKVHGKKSVVSKWMKSGA